MKVLLAVHGYPPELVGGTELGAQALARAAAAAGHQVTVVAGSLVPGPHFRISQDTDHDPESGAPVAVRRFHRSDLYFDHWQKGCSVEVNRAFRELLDELRPDVLQVEHWLRLSNDLVATAARAGVPAVVRLNDHTTTCLLTFRVHPGDRRPCAREYAPSECVRCAAQVPPHTPWVPVDQQYLAFGQRAATLARELQLARARLVPSLAHGALLARRLGDPSLDMRVVPPLRTVRLSVAHTPARPSGGERWRLGSWGHSSPVKGGELLIEALDRPALAGRVELCLAGSVPPPVSERELPVHRLGPYDPADLAQHPVSAVHVMLSGSLAPESYGTVADEALELGLPMILPRAGAFEERFVEQRGVLFYEPADPGDLAAVVTRLLDEPGLWNRLRRRLPRAEDSLPTPAQVTEHLFELWEQVAGEGAPDVGPKSPEQWYEERMLAAESEAWDDACSRATPAELGFPQDRDQDSDQDSERDSAQDRDQGFEQDPV